MIFSYRSVLIRIRTWIFNSYLNWNLILRTVWISHNNCCVFFTNCCCINWCLVLELSTFWKVTDVADGILSVWLIAWFNCLIFRSWIVLISVCAWILNNNLNWDFILRAVWISHNDYSVFFTHSCSINRCLILELSAFWKIIWVFNRFDWFWSLENNYCLSIGSRCILIGVCTWVFDNNLNWDFILRAVWVSHNDCCVFFTNCCCIYRCLIFKCSTTWKI